MAKNIKVYLDPIGNTMNIWWANPKSSAYSEETDSPHNNNVISFNHSGVPVGLEIIGLFPDELNIAKILQTKSLIGKTDPFLLESNFKISPDL